MHSHSPQPNRTLVRRNVRSIVDRRNEHNGEPSGNCQLPPAKRWISVLPGNGDSPQWGSFVSSTIPGDNSTPSSSLNTSLVADVNQRGTSTPSATQQHSMNTPTTMPGTSSHSTAAPGGTSTELCCIQPHIWQCYYSPSSQPSWKPDYPHP